jgi:Fe-Mn family superoxide dismutase
MERAVNRRETTRRGFLKTAGGGILALALATLPFAKTAFGAEGKPAFDLPEPPYPFDALEPHLSRRTLEFHHGKHHRAYVDKANQIVKDTGLAGLSLEELIRKTASLPDKTALFNNAAQAWNHAFYWRGMKPGGGGPPKGALLDLVNTAFGGYGAFREAMLKAAAGQFGSGWVWLVREKGGKLAVTATGNAGTPLTGGATPLLTMDVWEHAYYLDYQNRRGDYAAAFMDSLVNWGFVENNLKAE